MPTLDFKGKQFVYSHHLSVPFRELKIDAGKSLPGDGGPSLDDNLIIHGDNLDALKALLPKYAGKVDVIYIDPPYNTGNEGWAYNDNVNSPLMKEWLKKTASENPEVDKDDFERHDKWLSMIWPRLTLLRELLAIDGLLMISIDDNEAANLELILKEIFGTDSFIGKMIWEGGRKNDSRFISSGHEYVFLIAKSFDAIYEKLGGFRERKEGLDEIYKFFDSQKVMGSVDEATISKSLKAWYSALPSGDASKAHKHYSNGDSVGVYFSADLSGPDDGRDSRPDYDVIHPVTKKPVKKPMRGWRWEKATMEKKLAESRVHFGEDETTVPGAKIYLKDNELTVPKSVFYKDRRAASKDLKVIFGKKVFDFPKDHSVLKRLLKLGDYKDPIILDSFAGSGTTAHAVQALNAEDGGNRKFILIETEDYADTITAERVRRVMKGVPKAKDEALKNGLGGSFTYCELGDPIDMDAFFDDSKKMPAYDQLARYIAYTATGEALDSAPTKPAKDWFFGEVGGVRLHLIYKAQKAFMRGSEAALDIETARAIAKSNSHAKPVYVFAAAKYMGQKELSGDFGITFCQLPYAIHRIMGDSAES